MVGATRFERATSCSQSRRSSLRKINALHDNLNSLELKARSTRLRDLTATLDLHRSDAKHLQAAAENQKRHVIEAGDIARRAVQVIWSAAHLQRRANALAFVRREFDISRCPVAAETLAICHRSYLESRNLEWFFNAPARSVDDRVAALPELPGRSATVRKIAEDTPGLDLASILPEPAATELVAA